MKAAVWSLVLLLAGCANVGYSYMKDPNKKGDWPGSVVSVDIVNIYNGAAYSWIGPLAPVEAKGVKLELILDNGEKIEVVQPPNPDYTLTAGERITLHEAAGRIWAEPLKTP